MIFINRFVLILVIIGALNWGIIGIFGVDALGSLFGGQLAPISRIIYVIVGLAGIYSISFLRGEARDRVIDRRTDI